MSIFLSMKSTYQHISYVANIPEVNMRTGFQHILSTVVEDVGHGRDIIVINIVMFSHHSSF